MSSSGTIEDANSKSVEPTNQTERKRQKKKLTSKIWDDFTKYELEKEVHGKIFKTEEARCNHCKRIFNGASRLGTTHLKNHLDKCHSFLKNTNVKGQLMLQTSLQKEDGTSSLSTYTYDGDVSRKKLIRMFVMHEYPFAMVEHEGFIDFIKSLRPSFELKSRITLRKGIMETYLEEKKKVYDMFGLLSCRISATMDLWTSRQNKSYLCVTAHFIDDDWNLKKKIINFMHMGGRHTGVNLCNTFIKNMIDWNIDRKLFVLTLDNDHANDVCVREIVDRLQGTLVCNGQFFHVRCAAHIINLVVQDGLKKINMAIENIREMVKIVRSSPLQLEEFEKRAKECNLDTRRGLSIDVPTRWNSTYMMLRDACYYKEAFKRLQCLDPYKYDMCPTNDNWIEVKIFCQALKNFYNITELLSGTKYPTANLFFQEFYEI